jgi:ubiquinone/menaquinone biosynthesis C-methylase UbiE
MSEHRHFLPAAGVDWLLPFYDPLQTLMGGNAMRAGMIEHAAIEPGQRVLDIGCGTGSLVVHILQHRGDADVTGLDPDPKALARARKKAERTGVSARFEQGYSDDLPFEDDSFDFVFSSFMFHHLSPEVQAGTLAEVRRVLAPGGSFHLVDFRNVSQNGSLPERMQGGFPDAREIPMRRNLFGRVAHLLGHA